MNEQRKKMFLDAMRRNSDSSKEEGDILGPIDLKNFSPMEEEGVKFTNPLVRAMVRGYSDEPTEFGPQVVYPNQIDDKESGAIDTLDRVLALNVGDPSGSYNKLKSIYGPRGFEFSQSSNGDIVFKSPKAKNWSRLDPSTPDTNAITNPFGFMPNKIYPNRKNPTIETGIQDVKELGRDIVDVIPDVIQGAGTTALSAIGGVSGAGSGLLRGMPMSGARTGMTAGAALGGALGETVRQLTGKVTGYREAPFDASRVALQAGVDALLPNLIGSTAPKKYLEDAMVSSRPGLFGSSVEGVDTGVKVLNEAKKGLTDPKLPPELLDEAVRQYEKSTQGAIPALGGEVWNKLSGMTKEVKDRAFKPISPAAAELIREAEVTWGVGVKPPKNLAEVAPYIAEQGRAGDMVKIVSRNAGKAYVEAKARSGREITEALSKIKEPIDIGDEAAMFDDAIANLKDKKLRDPTKATQYDKTIAALEDNRAKVFGAPEDGPSVDDLRAKVIDHLWATARKGKTPGSGDMLHSTPEAAIGKMEEVSKAVAKMSDQELRATANLAPTRDALGTPTTPYAPLSEDAMRRVKEKLYFKMFGIKPPKGEMPPVPEGLDNLGARMWAVAEAKKMTPEQLRKAAGNLPGRSTLVDPDIAWSKFLTLKEMAGMLRRSDNADLVNGEISRVATRAERALNDKMYEQINKHAGKDAFGKPKDLNKQYKIFVNGDEDIAGLMDTINQGLSTAGKLFVDNKSHVRRAIEQYDELYGTKLKDQLEVLSVAGQFGPKGDWLPKSGAGTTSTTRTLQGMATGELAANTASAGLGLGPTGATLLSGAGKLVGGVAGSNKVVRGATKLGNILDQAYGRLGGDWNPASVPQTLGSSWMNIDNADQNKKLLKERYRE